MTKRMMYILLPFSHGSYIVQKEDKTIKGTMCERLGGGAELVCKERENKVEIQNIH